MPIGLFALAVSAFAIGTTEFVIVGLIPGMARDLSVSIPTAGLLVSLYALSITLGAPTVTALTGRLPRRPLAITLMLIFTLGNLIAAFAPGYDMLLAGRIVTGVAHGVFFSIGATVATSLVDKSRSSQAVALMFAGLTVAMVVGVPFGAFVGQHWGWRAPFLVVAALGAISVAGLMAWLPKAIPHTPPTGLISQLGLLGKPRLLAMYLVTTFGFGSSFVVFTYLSPLMTGVTHVSEQTVSLALMLFGVATVIGNLFGGRLADRIGSEPALRIVLIGLIVSLAALPLTASHVIGIFVNLFVWGVFAFAISPIMQAGVVKTAAIEAPDAVGTASGFNIAAFNLGISGASFIGGVLVDGPGVITTPWAAIALVALALLIVEWLLRQRRLSLRTA
ncbi:MFS transporter [Nguyenibacter vanlangensis]|uniref:MFS transporter n=1 Tax=Nguyenibacter vanlangensis TaxID=1216886 RepID=A0A7Y7IU73_9PROT|nr:MFS transporter [Nguyenibacter vanlangensis]NVN10484.1 MFS transporter [Nguyenibacter vanlangensis]